MCARCAELDKKIGHLTELAGRISDPLTLHDIRDLLAELQSAKRDIHSEPPRE